MTAANRPGGRPDGAAPGWKLALALVSLALSLLLWLNGLIDSLSRPSVGNDLNRRQLELAVLAEPSLNGPLRPLLAGRNPQKALAEAINTELNSAREAGRTIDPDLELEQALLLLRQRNEPAAEPLLRQLSAGAAPQALLAQALLQPDQESDLQQRQQLIEALPPGGVLRQWSCEALGGGASCTSKILSQRAAAQLLTVTLLPVLLLLLGVATLVRELWLRWRGKSVEAPALQGPQLSGVDAVLLIAGGFVVVGELLTPLLVGPY